MRRLLFATISIIAFIWAGAAQPASPQLKGQYAFTGEAHCLFSHSPFAADLTPTGPTNSTGFSVVGVRTFIGDGTGTLKARLVTITSPPNPAVSSSDFTAKFAYTVDGGGSVSMDLVPGTSQGTALSGPAVGSTYTLDHVQLSGLISVNHEMMTVATVEPIVETIVSTPAGGGASTTHYQICHRSRVMIRIGN